MKKFESTRYVTKYFCTSTNWKDKQKKIKRGRKTIQMLYCIWNRDSTYDIWSSTAQANTQYAKITRILSDLLQVRFSNTYFLEGKQSERWTQMNLIKKPAINNYDQ